MLGSIIAKYAKVKPRVDSNLGKGKPTKKELERWKIRRAKKLLRRHGVPQDEIGCLFVCHHS